MKPFSLAICILSIFSLDTHQDHIYGHIMMGYYGHYGHFPVFYYIIHLRKKVVFWDTLLITDLPKLTGILPSNTCIG